MRKISFILFTLIIVFGFIGCSSEPKMKEITVHVPNCDLTTKASEWQNYTMYIMSLDDISTIDYYAAGHSGGSFISASRSCEAVVQYHEGDTYYDIMDKILVTEPLRQVTSKEEWLKEGEEIVFVPVLIYMTRYGIPDLPFSTTGFLQDVEYDWNQPITSTDLYICFSEVKN